MRTVSFTTSFNPSLYFVFVLVALILLFPHLLAASRKPAPVDNRSAQTSAILHRPHPASVSTTPASAILTAAVSWATTSSAAEEGTTQADSPDPDSGLAGGTAESTLGSSAGGMAADTATTPGANTKTAASTVEKAAADGQDTDAGDENQVIPNTVKAQIRAALDLLVSQAKSSEGCPGQIEITDDISILKSVNSDILFQAIADCDGQMLFSLLPVITALGTVIPKDDPFALSGLGVAMLIRFFSEHTERHIVRRGLAMFYAMLPKTNRNVELFSWLLGIAKKRLYTANQEM
nr:hypothetical protein [Clostridiales bacterium]